MTSLLSKLALSFPSVFTAIGSFAFDFNETHVRNPNWPPHARYHNGQTMSMGLTLSAMCLYFTWSRLPLHFKQGNEGAAKEALVASWISGSLYCLTGLSAILYPGSSGVSVTFSCLAFI